MNKLKSIFYLSLVPLICSVFVSNFLFANVELSKPQWIGMTKDIGSVYLSWFRVQGAAAYIVERRIGEVGDFQRVVQVTNPAYRDFNISSGLVHFYRITPLDKDGNKGSVSDIRYIKFSSREQGEISPPQWEAHDIRKEGVALSWNHEAQEKVLAYNLYRRKDGENQYTLIASSMSSAYLDLDLFRGSTYHYVVTALDEKLQESDNSNILSVNYTEIPSAALDDERLSRIRTLDEVVRMTETDRIYSWETYGFISPVDVEYLPSNEYLYVSDSGTGLISVIDRQGELIWQLGGSDINSLGFDRLMGIAVDEEGYVYAVDAYLGEIAVFSPHGVFERRISLEKALREYFGPGFRIQYPGFRFGIVDIEMAGEDYLMVVDNPNGWVYILTTRGTLIRIIGEKGYEPDKLHYPTFALLDRNDRLIISDTLNSRVQVYGSDGSHLKIIGEKGLGIGQFLRPKGITSDDAGNLYIADSQHNVVQVFNNEFEFSALLGNEKGHPIDLGSPNGITFVEPDLLVICEKLSRRVQVRRLSKAVAGVSPGEQFSQTRFPVPEGIER